jgi:F1F0 ATPase subunit 2
MINNEWLLISSLLWNFALGILLGAFFFGGLWLTLHRVLSSSYSALWLLGSLLLRISVVLAGFYFIASDHWQKLAACLVGFIIARIVIVHLYKPTVMPTIIPTTAPTITNAQQPTQSEGSH